MLSTNQIAPFSVTCNPETLGLIARRFLRRQLILAINLVVCFSRNLSVIFRPIRAIETINSGINLNRDFGFNHTVSEADLWSR